MIETTPFLTTDQFQAMFARTLSVRERALTDMLVQAAANWIRERLPDLPVGHTEAKLVTYDVVSSVMRRPGEYAGFSQVTRTTDDRTLGWTLESVGDMLSFEDRHMRMLGLSVTAAPRVMVDPVDPRVYSGQW